MEIVISIAAKIAEYTVAPVGRQLGYIFCYGSNVDNLKTRLQTLEDTKATLQQRVEAAEQNGEEIFINVRNCLVNVDGAVGKINGFFQESEGRARGGCSSLWTRHQLSRKATKMAEEMSQVIAQGKEAIKMDKITERRRTLPVGIRPSERGYEALNSRSSVLTDIIQALKDPNIRKIGLRGMGGVGKSTLVEELVWEAEQDLLFGKVVKATVSNPPDVQKIQDQLAGMLCLKFDKETQDERARLLRYRITKVNNILVILDNIWSKLNLTEIGIPFGDDHKGCKLFLTSRDLNVLKRDMDTDKDFTLEVLKEDESWMLFKKTAGDVVEDHNIKPIAEQIARSCADLPLSIVTVASALRKEKELPIWKDALNKLTGHDHSRVKSQVYPAIQLSYDRLESHEIKLFFLFLASLANGPSTQDVLRYSWGLGLFKDVNTLADARNRLCTLTTDLRASCLLLEEGQRDYLNMHDVVYEVASSIAFEVQPFYTMPELSEVTKWPNTDILQQCHSIDLGWCYFHELPPSLDCPKLKLLCLNSKDNFLEVPDGFLVGMRQLQVLDFGGFNCCPSPPSSLCHLTNLRALYLCQSMLEDISIVAKLTNLEILSLVGSEIKELPIELAQLTRLRVLDLSDCSGLTVIPANLISSLTCMEELCMGSCYFRWEAEGSKNQSNNASLGELKHLPHLTTLELQIQHASILPRDLLIFERLERYNISVGCGWKCPWVEAKHHEHSRRLMLNPGTSANIHLDRGVRLLLDRAEELYLANVKGVENMLYQLNGEGFPQLKHLIIHDSDEIHYIIDSIEWVNSSRAFTNLESLVLHNLSNMTSIINGQLPAELFNKLKVIKVKGCNRLENLFLHSIVSNLSQLVEAEISQCNSITGIILDQERDDNNEIEELKFPNLSSLTLDCLPMLVSFSCKPPPSGMKSGTYDTTYEDDSNIPLALFDKKIGFSNLESLKISSINTRKIWVDQLSTHSGIQNLRSLTIEGCRRMEYLFPSSVARQLVNLRHLEITRCQLPKEIFDLPYGTNALPSDEATFPSLQTLIISHMGSLKSIWNNELTPNSFSKLGHMEISFCKMLPNIFSCYELSKLRNLERLLVTNCDALEVVFEIQGQNRGDVSQGILVTHLRNLTLERLPRLKHIWSKDPHGSITFENLCIVTVTECESLNHVFPLSVAKQLLQLQTLEIIDCGLENIVAKDEIEVTAPRLIFPQLTSLKFVSLAKLESIYRGIHTLACPKLRKLDVYHCDKLQVFNLKSQNYSEDFVPGGQPLFSLEKVICNIEELYLSSENITAICNEDCGDDVDFRTIPSLHLRCFHNNSDQIPWAFLQRVTNLENLSLECSSFIQIFPSEEIETNIKLKSLRLRYLWNLENLCQENSQIQPILQNLEELDVVSCERLKNIVPSLVLFQNLDCLHVCQCSRLTNITMLSTATSFMKLRHLHIHGCERIEEIVTCEEVDAIEVTFMKLECLQLKKLPRLRSFSKGNHSFKFPLLEIMLVTECPMMETFSHASVSTPSLRQVRVTEKRDERLWDGDLNATIKKLFNETIAYTNTKNLKISSINTSLIGVDQLSTHCCIQNLRSLTVDDCGSLEYLFPSSVAMELVNLQHLKITRCGMLKEIFDLGGKIGDFPSTSSTLSSKQATFPSLETLVISHMDSLTSVWNSQLAPNSFCSLANMEISFCQKLPNVFPCYVLNNLQYLETLLVTDCVALEVIFEIQGQNTGDASQGILATQLRNLTLERLPRLKHTWSKDPHGSIKFQNLCSVKVTECMSLNHVFPLSMAKHLLQLQLLDIRNCGVENIVPKDEKQVMAPRFVFPQLTSLIFQSLAKLESFYPAIHTLDCPKLRELDVYHCDKLQVFNLKSQNYAEGILLDRQPLFSFEKVICNIEELYLSNENITAICNDDCGDDVDFYTFPSLHLRCFHNDSDQIPWAFLQRFTNLEKLNIECSSFIQIFPIEEIETIKKLKSLQLKNLKKLENLCQENSHIQPILENLEELTIAECERLKNIVSSPMLFQNLDALKGNQCSGLINLTMPSTTTSFMKLRVLKIHNCERIEEIVASEEGDAGEIAFMKLHRLQLVNLPRLRSFCNGNHSFKFPSLQIMFVIECPMMETFSHDSLSTPRLRAVGVTWEGDILHWEGDLNATVKKLYNERVSRNPDEIDFVATLASASASNI